MQVAMILLGPHAPTLANLHRHGPRNNVSARQILRAGGVPFHEPLTLAVPQNSTLTSTSFRDETSRSVNSRGMELHELRVLIRQSGSHGHGVSISGAGVGRGARKVGTTVSPSGQNSVLGLDSVQGSILHVERHRSNALSIVRHEQIHGEVLDEVSGIKCQTAAIQRMKHGVPRTVRRTRASMGLSTLSKIQTLSPECSLINLPLLRPRERQAELLQLQHRLGRLPTHVVNGILIAQPIASLYGVVHVPSPIVRSHVPQCSVDAALGRDGVRSGGEEL
mmetsp:Transcript_12149/g.21809  ORF Transcript_12149/g.21809 Transcript_12149/m.21809 type:complete len:278 (+) Transcript_12149:1023-1856(+)